MVLLSCAGKFLKQILFFVNFLCAIAGIFLIVHGVLALLESNKLRSFLSNDHLSDTVPTIIICIGVFIFIISFFGCCGAHQSNICLLDTYSICLTLLVLLQIMIACFIFLFSEDIEKSATRSFGKIWRSRGNSRDSQAMIEMIQENLECCGSKDMFDYDMPMNIPKSCCSADIKACSTENSHEIGCRAHIQNLIRASSSIIAYSCIGVAIFQLMGAIMGFILSGYIKKVRQFRRCC